VQPVERDDLRRPHDFFAGSLVCELYRWSNNLIGIDSAAIDKRADPANELEVTNIVGDE